MGRNVRGFKPHVLREILDLPKERFRYWRSHIDPEPHKPYFTYPDILAYRIIKTYIDGRNVPVEVLAKADWTSVFKTINETHYEDLKKMAAVLNKSNDIQITLEMVENCNNALDTEINAFSLKRLVEEQIDTVMNFGV